MILVPLSRKNLFAFGVAINVLKVEMNQLEDSNEVRIKKDLRVLISVIQNLIKEECLCSEIMKSLRSILHERGSCLKRAIFGKEKKQTRRSGCDKKRMGSVPLSIQLQVRL